MSEAANVQETDMPEAEPPSTVAPRDHTLWPAISKALRSVYDPEIPVNIYELGLIYNVAIDEGGQVSIVMSLTAPGCPVAGEMPGQVQEAVKSVEGVQDAAVELVWDPAWNPSLMAETAKLQLNMY
jgi:FeS assembly SUF system protein